MGYFEQLAEIRRQEVLEEGKENFVRNLLAKTEFSPEKIAELADVPVALVKKVKKECKAK
jgi:hypothetical protein